MNIDINYIIRNEMLKQHITLGELTKALSCSRQNLYVKLKRNDLKLSDIEKIAGVLKCEVNLTFSPKN